MGVAAGLPAVRLFAIRRFTRPVPVWIESVWTGVTLVLWFCQAAVFERAGQVFIWIQIRHTLFPEGPVHFRLPSCRRFLSTQALVKNLGIMGVRGGVPTHTHFSNYFYPGLNNYGYATHFNASP